MTRITAEDEDEYGGCEVPRQGHGNVNGNGAAKLTTWILGIFGAVSTILLSLVLTAVYNMNGDMHEVKQAIHDLELRVGHLDGARDGRP